MQFWEMVGWELARLIVTTALVSMIVMFTLGQFIKRQGPEFAKQLLALDEKQLQQLHSVDARVNKKASQMVAKDIMTTTPLSSLVQGLSEETRQYLQEHPEALPGILQNYAGTVDLALKFMPQIQQLLGQAVNRRETEVLL